MRVLTFLGGGGDTSHVTSSGAGRLTDHVSLGAVTRVVPRYVVDEVLARTEKREKRSRLLPAHVVVYFVLALSLGRCITIGCLIRTNETHSSSRAMGSAKPTLPSGLESFAQTDERRPRYPARQPDSGRQVEARRSGCIV